MSARRPENRSVSAEKLRRELYDLKRQTVQLDQACAVAEEACSGVDSSTHQAQLSTTEHSAACLDVQPSQWRPIAFMNNAHYKTLVTNNSLDDNLARRIEAFRAGAAPGARLEHVPLAGLELRRADTGARTASGTFDSQQTRRQDTPRAAGQVPGPSLGPPPTPSRGYGKATMGSGDLSKQLAAANNEKQRLQAQNDGCGEELGKALADIERLKARAREIQMEAEGTRAELESLKRIKERVDRALRANLAKLLNASASERAELESQVKQLLKEMSEADERSEVVARELSATIETLEGEKRAYSAQTASLQEAQTNLTLERQQLAEQVRMAELQFESLQEVLKEAEEKTPDGTPGDDAIRKAQAQADNGFWDDFLGGAREMVDAAAHTEEAVRAAQAEYAQIMEKLDTLKEESAGSQQAYENLRQELVGLRAGVENQIKEGLAELKDAIKKGGGGGGTWLKIDARMATVGELAKAVWRGDARRVAGLLEAGVDPYGDYSRDKETFPNGIRDERNWGQSLQNVTPMALIFWAYDTGQPERLPYRRDVGVRVDADAAFVPGGDDLTGGNPNRNIKRGIETLDAIANARNGEYKPLDENTIRSSEWLEAASLISPELVAHAIKIGLLVPGANLAIYTAGTNSPQRLTYIDLAPDATFDYGEVTTKRRAGHNTQEIRMAVDQGPRKRTALDMFVGATIEVYNAAKYMHPDRDGPMWQGEPADGKWQWGDWDRVAWARALLTPLAEAGFNDATLGARWKAIKNNWTAWYTAIRKDEYDHSLKMSTTFKWGGWTNWTPAYKKVPVFEPIEKLLAELFSITIG